MCIRRTVDSKEEGEDGLGGGLDGLVVSHLADTFSKQDTTPLGFEYETTTISPETISIVPILRSGLGMVEGK